MTTPHRVIVTIKTEGGLENGYITHEESVLEGDLLDPTFVTDCGQYARDLVQRAANLRDPQYVEFFKRNPELA